MNVLVKNFNNIFSYIKILLFIYNMILKSKKYIKNKKVKSKKYIKNKKVKSKKYIKNKKVKSKKYNKNKKVKSKKYIKNKKYKRSRKYKGGTNDATDFLACYEKNLAKIHLAVTDKNGKHHINKEKSEQFINSQISPKIRQAAKDLIDNTIYITLEEVCQIVEQLILKVYEENNFFVNHDKIIFDVGPKEKSSYFLSVLGLSYIRKHRFKEPTHFIEYFDDTDYDSAGNNPIIMIDDSAYSGSQLSKKFSSIYLSRTKSNKSMPNIYCLMIALNTFSLIKLTKFKQFFLERGNRGRPSEITNLPFKILCLDNRLYEPLIYKLGIERYIYLTCIFSTFTAGDFLPNVSLYFDHKIADEVSTFTKTLIYGQIIPNDFFKKILLIAEFFDSGINSYIFDEPSQDKIITLINDYNTAHNQTLITSEYINNRYKILAAQNEKIRARDEKIRQTQASRDEKIRLIGGGLSFSKPKEENEKLEDIQADIQADGHADGQADGHADGQADGQAVRQAIRHADEIKELEKIQEQKKLIMKVKENILRENIKNIGIHIFTKLSEEIPDKAGTEHIQFIPFIDTCRESELLITKIHDEEIINFDYLLFIMPDGCLENFILTDNSDYDATTFKPPPTSTEPTEPTVPLCSIGNNHHIYIQTLRLDYDKTIDKEKQEKANEYLTNAIRISKKINDYKCPNTWYKKGEFAMTTCES